MNNPSFWEQLALVKRAKQIEEGQEQIPVPQTSSETRKYWEDVVSGQPDKGRKPQA